MTLQNNFDLLAEFSNDLLVYFDYLLLITVHRNSDKFQPAEIDKDLLVYFA